MGKNISEDQTKELFRTLEHRFKGNRHRHREISWTEVERRLTENPDRLWSLNEMEISGGEPDVIGFDESAGTYIFCDCSTESPKGRRSLCYDEEALASRKKHKPKGSATEMAERMGINLLNEEQYHKIQLIENFDNKTSSWLKTPEGVRQLGGAIFGDYRFGRVFIYHNGAESYYGSRGFRGYIKI